MVSVWQAGMQALSLVHSSTQLEVIFLIMIVIYFSNLTCAAALRAQRQHYTAVLEEHANLQQEHAKLEVGDVCFSVLLCCHGNCYLTALTNGVFSLCNNIHTATDE